MSLPRRLSTVRPGLLRGVRTIFGVLTCLVLIGSGIVGYNVDPLFYWYMIAGVVPAAGYLVFRSAVPFAEARKRARKRWKCRASSVERVPYTQFEEFRTTYRERTGRRSEGLIDSRTWSDLGMNDVLERIDVCFTMAGRNELSRILHHALPPASLLSRRRALIERFTSDVSYREQVAQELTVIGEERDADPAMLLWNESLRPDDRAALFVGMCLAAVASLVITAAVNLSFGLLLIGVVFVTNMVIYYRKARHISSDIPALRVLSRMTTAVASIPDEEAQALQEKSEEARGAFGLLLTGAPSASPTVSGDLMEMLFVYVKIFFQIDLIAYNRIVRTILKERATFQGLYRTIGAIDALYALASYKARRKRICDAAPSKDERLTLEGVYHPLVPKAVANTIDLGNPGAVVTGTNMAGKSTFLRTVGINVLFAQSTGFAFASAYRAPQYRLMSSIEKHDNLAEGKSFYFDEAERIYRMIEEVDEEVPVLLLIDELLAGTNSLERESASIAILHYLAEHNALTVAATHDVAIATGVAKYALYHFTDSADENGLSFDYTIRDGVVRTRNAIKLLRLIGYPEGVISAALGGSE